MIPTINSTIILPKCIPCVSRDDTVIVGDDEDQALYSPRKQG